MADCPLHYKIDVTYPDKKTETILCKEILRSVPGKRMVFDAEWNGKQVIAKIFTDKIRGWYHIKREAQGLAGLAERDVPAPKVLFYGKTEDNNPALIVEKITNSSTALQLYRKSHKSEQQLELLLVISAEIAKQHIKGILQKDLHLGNFLLQDEKIFWFDAARIKFINREVDRKTSIAQLAMLTTWLRERNDVSIKTFCENYFRIRKWQFKKPDEALFKQQLSKFLNIAIARELKKSLRTSKKYFKLTTGGIIAVFDRNFCTEKQGRTFTEQLDAIMSSGQILKNGNTSFVSKINWNERDIVLKRYNHKGILHSLRHTVKKPRALRCWLNGIRLGILDIATAKPLAYITQKKHNLIWQSYLVTEYVHGQNYRNILRNDKIKKQQLASITKKVGELLDKLGTNRITHGDMKDSNIIITEKGPVLIDLDGMHVHRCCLLYLLKRHRDIARFKQN